MRLVVVNGNDVVINAFVKNHVDVVRNVRNLELVKLRKIQVKPHVMILQRVVFLVVMPSNLNSMKVNGHRKVIADVVVKLVFLLLLTVNSILNYF
jgi:hypothetical protein